MAAANQRRIRRVTFALLGISVAFLILRLRSTWHESRIELDHLNWYAAAGALIAASVTVLLAALTWTQILRLLGVPARRRWASIFVVAQFAKYVPGGVWQYVGRAALASDAGVSPSLTSISVTVEMGAALASAAILALLLLGSVGAAAAACILAGAAITRPRWPRLRMFVRAAAAGLVGYVPAVALAGTSLWFVARALLPASGAGLPFYIGAWAAAWFLGVIAIFAPGGLGVREAVLIALLRPHIGTADAAVVAAASRLVVTVVDGLAASLGLAILRRERPRVPTAASASAGQAP